MATLFCFGLGYCAEHTIAEFGARFDRAAGTVRTRGKAAAIALLAVAIFTSSPPARAQKVQPDLVYLIAGKDGETRVLVSGNDFYSSPRLRT